MLVFAIAMLATSAQAEWKWQHFGADPFAETRAEAMQKRADAFRKARLPEPVISLLMEETKKPGEPMKIVMGDRFSWMMSKGDVIHGPSEGGVIVAWSKPSISNRMEYAQSAETWQVLWDGAIHTVVLPGDCFNWSGKPPMIGGPVPVVTAQPSAVVKAPVVPPPQPVARAVGKCPNGYSLIANVWSLASMPEDIRLKTNVLISVAEDRDSKNATRAEAYKPDDVSRTVGRQLRRDVRVRVATANVDIRIFYRDPKTLAVTKDLGVLRTTAGIGKFQFPDDPRQWIVETIWPMANFVSPTMSGGERRMWLFPYEWKDLCSMNEHGIIP